MVGKIFKFISGFVACLCFMGCATFHSSPLTLKEAVQASYKVIDKNQYVVLDVQEDGTVLIAGRPTTFAEIEAISYLEGVSDELGVFVKVKRDTKFAYVREVLDSCKKAGLDNILFKEVKW